MRKYILTLTVLCFMSCLAAPSFALELGEKMSLRVGESYRLKSCRMIYAGKNPGNNAARIVVVEPKTTYELFVYTQVPFLLEGNYYNVGWFSAGEAEITRVNYDR